MGLTETGLAAWGRRGLRWGVWLGPALLSGVAGCGGASGGPPVVTVYEVKGTVLLADGKPLSGGHVYFVPADGAMTSEGKIGPDGSFSLSTGRSGEGAPPGDYKVRVEPDDPGVFTAGRGRRRPPFPPKYLDEDGSRLTARVEPRANRLPPFLLR